MRAPSNAWLAVLFLTGVPAIGQNYIVSSIAGGGVLPTPVAAAGAAINPGDPGPEVKPVFRPGQWCLQARHFESDDTRRKKQSDRGL